MPSRAIVVVEDNVAIAQLVQEVLNDVPGYGAVTVGDGALALAVIGAVRTDLVILDVDLPGLDGFALYDRLHSQAQTADLPCLFMSASRHDAELARRGISGVLHKPFDLDDLLERVHSIFSSSHQDDRA